MAFCECHSGSSLDELSSVANQFPNLDIMNNTPKMN